MDSRDKAAAALETLTERMGQRGVGPANMNYDQAVAVAQVHATLYVGDVLASERGRDLMAEKHVDKLLALMGITSHTDVIEARAFLRRRQWSQPIPIENASTILSAIHKIFEEPLDERVGHGPTRHDQFNKIEILVKRWAV